MDILLFICVLEILQNMVVWEWERSPFPAPHVVVGRGGPEVIRSGELFLPFTSCSTWESGPALGLGNTVELALLV